MPFAHAGVRAVVADKEQMAARIIEPAQLHAAAQRVQPHGHTAVFFPCLAQLHARALSAYGQRQRQIARVHGGYKFAGHGAQGGEIIPIIGHAVPGAQAFQGIQGIGQAGEQRVRIQQPQLPRRAQRQQIHADVGGRCAHGSPARGRQLHIVRRQMMRARVYVFQEKLQGIGGDAAQRGLLPAAERRLLRAGTIQPAGQQRLSKPDRPQREPRPEYAPRSGKEHERAGQHGGKIQPQRAQIALLGLGGGGPLQQSFMADAHTPQRAQDCIQPGDGHHGQQKQRAQLGGRAQRQQRQDKGQPRALHGAENQGNQARCRHKRAAQVIQNLEPG